MQILRIQERLHRDQGILLTGSWRLSAQQRRALFLIALMVLSIPASFGMYGTPSGTGTVVAESNEELDYVFVADQKVRALDVADGSEVWSESHEMETEGIALAPDYETVYAVGQDASVRAVDTADGSQKWTENDIGYAWSIAVTPDDQTVIIGGDDGQLVAYDTSDGSIVWQEDNVHGSSEIVGLTAGIDGDFIFTAAKDNDVKKVDTSDGSVVWTSSEHSDEMLDIAAGPEGESVYSIDMAGDLKSLDVQDGSEQWSSNTEDYMLSGIAVDPDGNSVFVVSWNPMSGDSPVESVDASDGSQEWETYLGSGTSEDIGISPDGERVYVSDGSDVYSLDANDGSEHWESSEPSNTVLAVAGGGEITGEMEEPLSGKVIDQHSDPVANATVEVWGVDYDHADIEGHQQRAEELLDEAQEIKPPEFDLDVDPVNDVFTDVDEGSTYAVVHTADQWDLSGVEVLDRAFTVDTTELDAPDVVVPEDETLILSIWDADEGATLQDTVDASLPGSTTSGTVVIESLDASTEPTSTTTRETEEIAQVFTILGNRGSKTHEGVSVSLEPGFYRIYPEDNEAASYTVAVGDPSDLIGGLQDDLVTEADNLVNRAEIASEALGDDKMVREVVQADQNGEFSVDLSPSVERVAIQSYSTPDDLIADPADTSLTEIQSVFEDGYSGSIYYGHPQRFDTSTEDDIEVEVIRVPTPPGTDIEDQLGALEEQFNDLLNETMADLEGVIDGILDNINTDELEKLHDEFNGLVTEIVDLEERIHDPEELATILADILEEPIDDDLDEQELIEQIEAMIEDLADDPTDLEEDDLIKEIEALEATVNALEETIEEVAPPESEIDASELFYEVEFPVTVDEDDLVTTVSYEDGTTEVISDDFISVSDDGLLDQHSIITIEEYEIDDDAAVANVRVQILGEEVGSSTDHIVNPAFQNDIPKLDAIDISTDRPGTDERVAIEPRPDSDARFGEVTNVTVVDPDGAEITADLDDDRATFRTDDEGIYDIRMTMENQQGDEFIESIDIRVRDEAGSTTPTIRFTDGTTGTFAIAADGLESGRLIESGDQTRIVAITPDEETPGELHVHPGRDILAGDSHDLSVEVYQGSVEEQIRSHVAVFIHIDHGLSNDAILWRNGEPITRSGDTRFGEIDERDGNKEVLVTFTDANGQIHHLAILEDPRLIDRAYHLIDRMTLRLPIIGLSLPRLMLASLPIVPIAIRRRRSV